MTPIRSNVYTTEEVYQLELLDMPFLMVYYKEEWHPIQTSASEDKDVIAAFPSTLWKYARTTEEWIPLFYAVDSEEVLKKLIPMNCWDHDELHIKKEQDNEQA